MCVCYFFPVCLLLQNTIFLWYKFNCKRKKIVISVAGDSSNLLYISEFFFIFFLFFFHLKWSEIFHCEAEFIIACCEKKENSRDSISTPYATYVIGCTFPISIDLAVVNIYDAISILTLVRSWNHWLINIYSSICVLCEHIQLRLKFPIHCGRIGILSITTIYFYMCAYVYSKCVRVRMRMRVCLFIPFVYVILWNSETSETSETE